MSLKSVLFNLGVFLTDANVRRNLRNYSYNFTSPTASVANMELTLLPGETTTWNTVATESSATLVAASGKLRMSFTFALLPGQAAANSYAVENSSLHFVDDNVRQIVLTNNGTSNVTLSIVQS